MQLAVDPVIFEQLVEESKHIDNIQVFTSPEEVIKHEPILMSVKDRIYGGVFSSSDTNGNIYEFCCELKRILIEKYNVQFVFNEEIQDFIVSTTVQSHTGHQQRHISGFITTNNRTFQNADNIILANGNYVMPLAEKLKIYIPVYPVKVKKTQKIKMRSVTIYFACVLGIYSRNQNCSKYSTTKSKSGR